MAGLIRISGGMFMGVVFLLMLRELIPDSIALTVLSFQLRPIDKDTIVAVGVLLGFVLGYFVACVSAATNHRSDERTKDESST